MIWVCCVIFFLHPTHKLQPQCGYGLNRWWLFACFAKTSSLLVPIYSQSVCRQIHTQSVSSGQTHTKRIYMWPWVHRRPHLKYIHIWALSSLRPEPNDQFAVYDLSEREPIECIHPRNIVQYRVDRLNPAKWKRLCVCNAYMRTCGPRNRASYLLGLMDGRWPSLGWLVIIYHRLN